MQVRDHEWDEVHSYSITEKAEGEVSGTEVHQYMEGVVDVVRDAIDPLYRGQDSYIERLTPDAGELNWENDEGKEYTSISAREAGNFEALGYDVCSGTVEVHGVEYESGIDDEPRSELVVEATYEPGENEFMEDRIVVDIVGSEAGHVVEAKDAIESEEGPVLETGEHIEDGNEPDGLFDRIMATLPDRNSDFVY